MHFGEVTFNGRLPAGWRPWRYPFRQHTRSAVPASRAKDEQSYGSFAARPIIFGSGARSDPFLQRPQNADGIGADCLRNHQKLYDIEPALTAFDLGNEGLRLFKPAGEVVLGEPGRLARLHDQVAKGGLGWGMDRFCNAARAKCHGARQRDPIIGLSQNGIIINLDLLSCSRSGGLDWMAGESRAMVTVRHPKSH